MKTLFSDELRHSLLEAAGPKVEIRKPTQGAYIGTRAVFGRVYSSADSIARTEREVYIDGELRGALEKEEDGWWAHLEGITPFRIPSLRSMRAAEDAIRKAWVKEHQR